ncbi:AAA family ATPase [Actinoplanes sp. NPDC023714]|uniref:AAA family ATPase n=1 Tax=Actinoplanes sp. NPDC023714 TaxID=3154322 RepID=UPI0033D13773
MAPIPAPAVLRPAPPEPVAVAESRRQARLLAIAHAGTAPDLSATAEQVRDALRRRWDATLAGLRPYRGEVLRRESVTEVEQRAHRFLAGRAALFAARIDRGRPDDLIAELAARAMDLERRGGDRAAGQFLDWYARFGGDPVPAALLHLHLAYQGLARVRAGCLRHARGDRSAAADVTAFTDLTLRHLRTGTVRLILVGGPSGAGRSLAAGRLADELGAVVLSSDRIRREIAGLDPHISVGAAYREGIHTTEWTERTYAELLWRADHLLRRAETVVLDASWRRRRHRLAARAIGAATYTALTELCCATAPGAADDDWPEAHVIEAETGDGGLRQAMRVVTVVPATGEHGRAQRWTTD